MNTTKKIIAAMLLVGCMAVAFVIGFVGATAFIDHTNGNRPSDPNRPALTLPQCLRTGGRIVPDGCVYPLEPWHPLHN